VDWECPCSGGFETRSYASPLGNAEGHSPSAGSLRVSLSPMFFFLPRLGARGLNRVRRKAFQEVQVKAPAGGLVVPRAHAMRPYMVKVTVQHDAAGGLGVSPSFLTIPQEWGIKGVERESASNLSLSR
jgi:hypothetical protein